MVQIPGLPAVPWYFLVIAVVAFLVTITGVIVWQVIQGRMEAEAERLEEAGKGIAPIQHPEPLRTWCAMACAAVDGGTSWTDEPAEKAQRFIGNMWNAMGNVQVEERLTECQQREANAWNLVGALRLAIAAQSAGYLPAARAWQWARLIAQALQQRYPSFEAIGHEYLAARRQWKHLPPDGSGDDDEQRAHLARFESVRSQAFRGVDYRAAI